jgi:hypothetical protein
LINPGVSVAGGRFGQCKLLPAKIGGKELVVEILLLGSALSGVDGT